MSNPTSQGPIETTATVLTFSREQGFGRVRLADGRELPFDFASWDASTTSVDPGTEVQVEVGISPRTGRPKILLLWGQGQNPRPPPLPSPPPPSVEPDTDEIFRLLQEAGFLTNMNLLRFRPICQEAAALRAKDEDLAPLDSEEINDDLIGYTLALLYGTGGPTPASLADSAFIVDDQTASDPSVVARVRSACEAWLGRGHSWPERLDGAPLERLLRYVGDVLYLRAHERGDVEQWGERHGDRELADYDTGGGPGVYAASWLRAERTVWLYAWRSDNKALEDLPTSFSQRYNRKTWKAVNGDFSPLKPSMTFAQHAPSCEKCRRNLLFAWASRGEMSKGYRRLLPKAFPVRALADFCP